MYFKPKWIRSDITTVFRLLQMLI